VRGNHAVWAGRTLRTWSDVLVETLVAEFDPVCIILFGSVASGLDGPDSDKDDLAAARVLVADGSTALRTAGFLAQQAAEKC